MNALNDSELKVRTKRFGLRVMKLVDALPNTMPGRAIGRQLRQGAAQPRLDQQALNRIPIPIPESLARQQSTVAEIDAEQEPVAGDRELIRRFEKKIEATIAGVWCDDEGADGL